tara:strand:+ start:161 stop:742 length:582 start_codon:yes stop_codon:yes gene_type:complete
MPTYQMINDRFFKMKTVEYMLYGLVFISLVGYAYSNTSLNDIRENKKEISAGHMRSLVQTSAASYLSAAAGLLFLIIFSITLCTNESDGTFKRMIMYPLPVLITIISFGFCAVQTLSYQNKIVENKVPNEYLKWKNIFTMLSIIQVLLIFYYLIADCKNTSSIIKYFIYIIGLFNIISLCIMQTILSFFCTDG